MPFASVSPHSSGMDSPRRGPDSISAAGRFIIGKQSALAQEAAVDTSLPAGNDVSEEVDNTFLLMYLANEGNVGGIEALIEGGVDVNFRDIDNRTALHVAACQGQVAVAELLLRSGAKVDAKDRWGSTPLVDAIHYRNHDMIRILEKFGARLQMAPMHVKSVLQIPEYEINPREFDFSKSVGITKKNLLSEESAVISGAKRSLNQPYKIARSIDVFSGTYRTAKWRGIRVAVKVLGEELIEDGDKVRAFRDELELLQQIRHPNVVQFLGAVTQSSPMMIVTEYLPKGDFRAYLRRKGALKPSTAVRYALDIARGMNYLHEHKPEPIIHRDLEPTNLLLDDSSHLKVADFGVSKLLKVPNSVQEERHLSCKDTSCRYSAPEILLDEEYGTGVDVFSFALILQEMIEGTPPLSNSEDREVPKAYIAKERPPFKASPKLYRYGLKELIEQCWSDNPANRPTFREIICLLSSIQKHIAQRARWKVMPLLCFQNLEAVWKKDNFEIRSHSSFSSFSSNSRF